MNWNMNCHSKFVLDCIGCFNSSIILREMIIFQSLQNHLSNLGINLNQSIEKYPWNVKNVLGLLWFGLMVIISNTFSDAQSFKDYIIILNASLPFNVMCIEFALHVLKMQKIFQFIICLDHLITESEYKLYCIIKLSKFIHFYVYKSEIHIYFGLKKI